jgi:hypothetical protein
MNDQAMHYYGDVVRKLFLAAGIFMLVMLAFMNTFLPVPLYGSIAIALGICIFAGLTNPVQKWVTGLNVIIALTGTAIAENQAVLGYNAYSLLHRTFWANQILAVIFLFALYFSTKTLRGMLLK